MIKAKKCKGGVWDDDDDEYYGLLNGEVCKADDGSCRLFKGECDREVVYIYRESEHAATQAALAAADDALEYSRKRIAGKKQHDVIDGALARLRALGKG